MKQLRSRRGSGYQLPDTTTSYRRGRLLRASLALLVSFCFLALGGIGSLHSPPAWGTMMGWQLIQFLAALILTIGSVLFTFVKPRTPE